MAIRQREAPYVARRPAAGAVRRPLGRWLLHGLIGGIIAGVVFAAFEMMVAALLKGSMDAFWDPMRMIGAMVLGEAALEPTYALATAAITGFALHMMFSVAFGLVFAFIAWAVPALGVSPAALVVGASAYGLLLWLLNFYAVAPAAGWTWFPEKADQFWQGFVAHAFMFGSVLGAYLARRPSSPDGAMTDAAAILASLWPAQPPGGRQRAM